MNHARRARAAARADWTVTAHRLEDPQPPRQASAAERVAAVWQITLDTWALSGRKLPNYERSEMPIVARRLRDV